MRPGLQRALAFKGKLTLAGFISLSASEPFAIRNLNRDRAGQIEAMRQYVRVHREAGVPIAKIIVMAAFGCNFAGDVSPAEVVETVADGLAIAREAGVEVQDVTLADSMGWATPRRVADAIGAVRDRFDDMRIALHLHDTRGQGIACAYEGLRLGVTAFDAAVGGPRRLPVCRPAGGAGQHRHRRTRAALRGDGYRHRPEHRGADRGRAACRADRRTPAAERRIAIGNARRIQETGCMTTSSRPLAGLKVLDFGHTIMGPCAGVVFADLGADVVKIEPVDGDPTRRLPGFAAGFFATYNRNKRSIAIDLKRPEGQAIVHRLVRDADVVLENFGPGTIERLKCSWEDLRQINPRLVYLSMKGFLKGPYENRGALDEVVQMQSGLAYMTGPPGRPLRAGAPVIDILGGVFGVVAALAALRERDATGIGQKVASSLFESATFMLGRGRGRQRCDRRTDAADAGPQERLGRVRRFHRCRRRPGFIGCTSDGHWQRFCETSASTNGATIRGLQDNTRRCEAREWMLPELERRITKLPLDEILEKCEAARVAYSRVGRPDELSIDPHLLAHGGLLATAVSGLGGGPLVGIPALPVEFGDGRERAGLDRQPPKIGEHAHEILSAAGYRSRKLSNCVRRAFSGEATSVPA